MHFFHSSYHLCLILEDVVKEDDFDELWNISVSSAFYTANLTLNRKLLCFFISLVYALNKLFH